MEKINKKIIWLENDQFHQTPYLEALKAEEYEVDILGRVLEGEEKINNEQYDLLILDIMIPTKNSEEEKYYSSSETKGSEETGLIFYRRMKDKLREKGIPVLVFTLKTGEEIKNAFFTEGLPEECYSTKLNLRKVPDFLEKIDHILKEKR